MAEEPTGLGEDVVGDEMDWRRASAAGVKWIT
jgi:hypothetical protein